MAATGRGSLMVDPHSLNGRLHPFEREVLVEDQNLGALGHGSGMPGHHGAAVGVH
jgi:hypothetical protein